MNKIYADVDYTAVEPSFQWVVLASEAEEREAALREELEGVKYTRRKFCQERDALQQRLIIAEQRASDMVHALTIADEYLCAAESLLDRGEDDSFNLEPAIITVRDVLKTNEVLSVG